MWCVVRLMTHATQGEHATQIIPELTVVDALKRWEVKGVDILNK